MADPMAYEISIDFNTPKDNPFNDMNYDLFQKQFKVLCEKYSLTFDDAFTRADFLSFWAMTSMITEEELTTFFCEFSNSRITVKAEGDDHDDAGMTKFIVNSHGTPRIVARFQRTWVKQDSDESRLLNFAKQQPNIRPEDRVAVEMILAHYNIR